MSEQGKSCWGTGRCPGGWLGCEHAPPRPVATPPGPGHRCCRAGPRRNRRAADGRVLGEPTRGSPESSFDCNDTTCTDLWAQARCLYLRVTVLAGIVVLLRAALSFPDGATLTRAAKEPSRSGSTLRSTGSVPGAPAPGRPDAPGLHAAVGRGLVDPRAVPPVWSGYGPGRPAPRGVRGLAVAAARCGERSCGLLGRGGGDHRSGVRECRAAGARGGPAGHGAAGRLTIARGAGDRRSAPGRDRAHGPAPPPHR